MSYSDSGGTDPNKLQRPLSRTRLIWETLLLIEKQVKAEEKQIRGTDASCKLAGHSEVAEEKQVKGCTI